MERGKYRGRKPPREARKVQNFGWCVEGKEPAMINHRST
jgi:hypothetical protein